MRPLVRKINKIITLSIGVFGLTALPLVTQAFADTGSYVPGEVLVEWNTGIKSGASIADRVSVVPVSDVEQAVEVLRLDSRVKQVEPNYKRYLFATPNDIFFSDQFHLEQNTDADIDAAAAWDTTTGDRSIVVAVIDSGVDIDHPDLIDNIWTNSDEIAGNGLDDDLNGYIDDVNGWDFMDNDNDPNSTPIGVYNDTYVLHGTHVAGIIGATGNNGQGVTGVNWEVSLMPLRIFGDNGESDIAAIIDAIAYAQANGADILNMSYGSYYASSLEEAAMTEAYNAGLLSVAAAGNDMVDLNTTPSYPICYDNVIGVSAVDATDAAASFTNYGTDCVDLAAPGDSILSTYYYDVTSTDYTEPYGYFSGTSMATPVVVGVAALLKAYDPTLDPATLIDLLVNTTDILSDATLGSGRVNVAAALDYLIFSGPDPVAIKAYHTNLRATIISNQERTRDSTPYFYWPEPASIEDIAGYYVYFGRERLDPVTAGTLQTDRVFEPPPIHGNETNYRLRIRTLDAVGGTSYLTQFIYSIDTKIKRPTWQSVERIFVGVRLHWYRPKREHTLGYYVYRSTTQNGPFTKITNNLLSRHQYTDNSVSNGRTYYYKIRAIDDLGNVSTLSEAKRIKL